jgi:hypothetical protein
MRLRTLILVGLGMTTLALPERANSQFIASDQDKGNYLNYSGRNYENYSSVLLRRKFYDNFGNFLVDGVTIFGLSEEQRPANFEVLDIPISSLSKSRFYSSYFTNLVILNDSYDGLTSRLMIGDALRTKFTSLTLDKARFNGIRWDFATTKYRGTVLASRISDPLRINPENVLTLQQIRHTHLWTEYLLGGHFETDIGDILTLGATYVNQAQRRSTLDSKDISLRGVPANAVPRVIFVRVHDDSPGDNSGPIIYSTPQIVINGKAMPMVNINGRTPDPQKVDLRYPIQYWVLRDFQPIYVATYPQRDTVSQTDYVHYSARSALTPVPQYPYQLPSDRIDLDYNMTYAYVIPPGVNSVDFSVILANDYRVDAGHDWINNIDEYNNPAFRSHADSIVTGPLAVPTTFRNMARADGNVKDGSNKRVVTFSYGLVSGMAVYGMNFKFSWEGFNIDGEIVRSVEFMKYPIGQGALFEDVGRGYFIRGTKKIGRLTLGGERYNIEPKYTTMLNLYTLDNSYYGGQNTPVPPDFLGASGGTDGNPPDVSPLASLPGQYIPGQAGGAVYSLVDDNDDNDRWEDGFYHYNVRATPDIRNGDVINYNYRLGIPGFGDPFLLGYRQNTNELVGLGDIIRRPDAGIFPGRDKDHDGIPDDDRNSDGIPDYVQDFLTFYTDPPFFMYGDDWNNNGVIDEQENDILPDYAYNPDLDGYHLFGSFEIIRSMNLRVGTIREKATAQGGKNSSDYVRWTFEASTPKFGGMNLFYLFKRVHDNIPNNGYQFVNDLTINSSIPDFVFDPLEYKNSLVNQFYLGTVYSQVPDLRIENNFKYEYNNQSAVGTGLRDSRGVYINPDEQTDGHITKLGIVNKIEYTVRLLNGRLALIPQFKVRTQKILQREQFRSANGIVDVNSVKTHKQEVIPIIRIDYRLTDRTDLRFGLQGFSIPGTGNSFNYQIKYLNHPESDENRSTFAISVANKTAYGGYNVVIDMGYKLTSREFPRQVDQTTRERKESLIYLSIYAGF